MKSLYKCILLLIILSVINPIQIFSQNIQEIEVIIGGISSSEKIVHFNAGEELRQKFKFREAIEEYEKVVSDVESCGKESEALYNIGLCYTWIQDFKEAREYFDAIIDSYSDDYKATAYAEYGLAWINTKEGNYTRAIERLEQKLNEKNCPDTEHNAVMQYQIGRIYLVYLKNHDKANKAFRKVLDNYSDSKISDHYYMKQFKMKHLNN